MTGKNLEETGKSAGLVVPCIKCGKKLIYMKKGTAVVHCPYCDIDELVTVKKAQVSLTRVKILPGGETVRVNE